MSMTSAQRMMKCTMIYAEKTVRRILTRQNYDYNDKLLLLFFLLLCVIMTFHDCILVHFQFLCNWPIILEVLQFRVGLPIVC